MKINFIPQQIRNTTANCSFCRSNRDEIETLKQYELNRNKSLDYIFSEKDKAYLRYVTRVRQKGVIQNIPASIKKYFYVDQFGRSIDSFTDSVLKEYDTFNYPRLYRGVGKKEVEELLAGKQIYSEERGMYFGVDVTNTPGGIGYGDYLVKFKLKPNLDLFIGSEYNTNSFSKDEHSMPHIYEWGPLPRCTLRRHTVLAGTYTINDVEEIVDVKTQKIVYSSKDEKIPDKQEMLENLYSPDKKVAIKALENLQTYTGHGDEFLCEAQFFLLSEDSEVRESYLNAVYNYGTKNDLPMVLDFMHTQENLSPDEIARLLNCLEKFGEKGKEDASITYLIDTISLVKDKDDLDYLCRNLYGAIRQLNYDYENNYSTLKKYLKKDCLPLAKLVLELVPPCEETDNFVAESACQREIRCNPQWRKALKTYSRIGGYL